MKLSEPMRWYAWRCDCGRSGKIGALHDDIAAVLVGAEDIHAEMNGPECDGGNIAIERVDAEKAAR